MGGREGEGYISPAIQLDAIRAYAQEIGGEIVATHTDENLSGGTTDRPGFQAALERIRAGETDGVVVMRIDRFARSVADGARIVRELVDSGNVFASCHERIDPRTPEGRFMLTSFLANAELFLDQAKAGWWTAKRKAVARGAHIGPTPIGYQRRQDGRLEPCPLYAPAIGELFDRAARREDGDTALARWMQHRAPRNHGRAWQSSEIRRWLRNRVYLGEVRYGQLLNETAHQPLTDPDTFRRAQHAPGTQRKAGSPFLLAGVVRCATCRYAMGGHSYGGTNHTTPIYRCSNMACPERSVIVAANLEAHVTALASKHMRGLVVRSGRDTRTKLRRAEKALDRARMELHAFATDLDARRILGEPEWRAGLEARAEARDQAVAAHQRAMATAQLDSLAKEMSGLDQHDLRDLLTGLVRHVFVRRRRAPAAERALVVWSDDPRTFPVPGPRRSGVFQPVRW